MAAAVWADLGARFGILREDPATWTVTRPFQLGPLVKRGAFEALGTPELGDLADALMGAGCWERPPRWGGTVLVTFPEPVFAYPRVVWHFDLPEAGRPWPFPVLRLFTFLEPVEPGGGGTFCIAGSATLAARLAPGAVSSKRLRKRVRARYPALAALCDTPCDRLPELVGVPHVIDGVEVVVEELSGQPGDAVIMHPLTLHAGAQNRRDRPRMMLAQSILAAPAGARSGLVPT
ncbi:MAG TPA: phytanoyl-CoA dioxygenase family protein [Caulobacteraceae bacterium]|nr:phytanoyl-CoA dioxygenase family protein [Caulobacteraceae bacterium]